MNSNWQPIGEHRPTTEHCFVTDENGQVWLVHRAEIKICLRPPCDRTNWTWFVGIRKILAWMPIEVPDAFKGKL